MQWNRKFRKFCRTQLGQSSLTEKFGSSSGDGFMSCFAIRNAAFCRRLRSRSAFGQWRGRRILAFLSGFVLYVYLLYLLRGRMSKIATNISGGALVTLIAVFLYHAQRGAGGRRIRRVFFRL